MVRSIKKANTTRLHKIKPVKRSKSETNLSTNGIEIHKNADTSLSREARKYAVSLDIWDFGGQEIFYPTHQFFLSDKAVYLVLFRCDTFQESRVEYWLKTLRWITNNSPNNFIYLVGTRADLVDSAQIESLKSYISSKYTKQFYRGIQKEVLFVNAASSAHAKHLYQSIIDHIIETKFLPIHIPESWARLNCAVDDIHSSKQIIPLEEFKDIALTNGLLETEFMDAVLFLSGQGRITYLGDTKCNNLGQYVVLQPQWLVDILSSVITFKHSFLKNGIVEASVFPHILAKYPTKQHDFILSCLEKFKVIVYIKKLDQFLAPSLLTEESDLEKLNGNEVWGNIDDDSIVQGRNYQFTFLPMGFMSQVIGRVLLLDGVDLRYTWRNGIVIEYKNRERVLITLDPIQYSLDIRVRFKESCPLEALCEINYIIDSTLSILYNAKDSTQVSCTIPCSHCLTENPSDSRDFHEFTLRKCVMTAFRGNEFIRCPIGEIDVSLVHTAPDVLFSFIHLIPEENLKLDKILGKGGFGSVYLAELTEVDSNGIINTSPVAVKELSLTDLDERKAADKFSEFFAEVAFMKQLDHHCIVKLYGIRNRPVLGMVMELLPGGDLSKFISSVDYIEFPWNLRVGIAYDIAQAMKYMDSKQLVHRDLRTENILMKSTDPFAPVRAKLADFGLSRQLIGESREHGHQIWQYNPPERLRDNIYDIRSDVYSFGICCWEIASRRIPYEEWDNNDKYFKVFTNGHKEIQLMKLKDDIIYHGLRPSMDLIDMKAPAAFITLIQNCWKEHPSERPTFSELVETLEGIWNSF